MFIYKYFLTCYIALQFSNSVLCDSYKNNPPGEKTLLNGEVNRNGPNHVYSNQNIPVISKELFWELNSVEELKVESCNVTSIEDNLFYHFQQLKDLSLKNNLLEKIESRDFLGAPLENLDLSYNQIQVIAEDAFYTTPHLRSINLRNNKIQVFDNWFKYAIGLCEAFFQNNLLKSVPSNVLGPYREDGGCRVDLYLNSNQIETVNETAFTGITFNYLYLDHNKIKAISNKTISLIKKVYVLRLDHNKICTLPYIGEKAVLSFTGANPSGTECVEQGMLSRPRRLWSRRMGFPDDDPLSSDYFIRF